MLQIIEYVISNNQIKNVKKKEELKSQFTSHCENI